jgi:hypothetical protein
MKLTLAAGIATAVASWACASATFGSNARGAKSYRESIRRLHEVDDDDCNVATVRGHRYDVPPEILVGDCVCREEVVLAVHLALEGE